jgi:hypothetical protein
MKVAAASTTPKETRNFTVAHAQGKSKRELEIEITKAILDGKDFRQVSN